MPERGGAVGVRPCIALLAASLLTGCGAVEYYAQSVTGHLGLMARARPIEKVVTAPDTERRLAVRLRQAVDMREFASRELGLPENASYRRYVDLERSHVVWNVVAAPELSLEPRRLVLSGGGMPQLSRVLLQVRRRGVRGRTGARRLGRDGRRGPCVFDTGLVCRPPAELHGRAARVRPRGGRVPRARSPAALRARRHRFQRVLRRGRAGVPACAVGSSRVATRG